MAMIIGNHLAARATYDHAKCDTTAWTGSSIITFDPPAINIDVKNFDFAFTLQLTNPPNGAVGVYLDAGDGIKFSKNSYVFDHTNWNTTQNGNIVTLPSIGDSTETISVNVAVDAPCEVYNGCTQVYTGSRTVHPPKTCAMWGDPHIITFGNYHLPDASVNSSDVINFVFKELGVVTNQFTVSLTGTFYAVKSPHLVIETTFFACVIQASCLGAVAFQYGDSKVVFSIFDQTSTAVNLDAANTVTKPTISLPTNQDYGISKTSPDGTHYSYTLSDGTEIVINIFNLGGLVSLDLIVTLPSGYYGNVEGGLCNRMETTDPNQLDLPNGQSSTKTDQNSVSDWATAWKVDPGKSLFGGGVDADSLSYSLPYTPVAGVDTPPGGKWTTTCASDSYPVTYPSPKHTPGTYDNFTAQTYTYNNDKSSSYDEVQGVYGAYTIAMSQDYKAPSKDDIGKCENQCGNALSSSNCDAISANSSRIYANACVSDCLSSNSYAFMENHKVAYLSSCQATAKAYTYSTNPDVAAKGYGYQNSVKASCKADANGNVCSGNAVSCSDSVGCQCKAGYTGSDCGTANSNGPSDSAAKDGTNLVNNNGYTNGKQGSGAADNVYGKNNGKSPTGNVGYTSGAAPMRTNSLVAVVLAAFAAVLVL